MFGSQGTGSTSEGVQIQDSDCQSDQLRGLVCRDRSTRSLTPHSLLTPSREVSEICFWGKSTSVPDSSIRPSIVSPHLLGMHGHCPSSMESSGHPHSCPLTTRADGSTPRCCSESREVLGNMAQSIGKITIASSEKPIPGGGVGYSHDAGTIVSSSDTHLPYHSHVYQARPGHHYVTLSKSGLAGSSVQHTILWPAVHGGPVVVAQDQWVFPEREPTPHDQSYAHMPSFSDHGEEVMVPAPSTCVGNTGSEETSERPLGSIFDRHYVGGLPDRRGGSHPVEAGAAARGFRTPPQVGFSRDGGRFVRGAPVSPSCGRPPSAPPLPCSSSSAGSGYHDTDMVEAMSVYTFPDCSAPGGSRVQEGSAVRDQLTLSGPVLTGPNMASKHLGPSGRPSAVNPDQDGPPSSAQGHDISPLAVAQEATGLAPEGDQFINSGLSTEVVETILNSRAPSTRKLYAFKWKIFILWCREHQLDPVNCPVASVLEFLQNRFSDGLSPSTLKVYVAAISAFHTPLGVGTLGTHPLIIRFLRGARRMRPAIQPRVPTWDLAVVLEGLSLAPFEPLDKVSEKFLSFKVAFLLAITSLKRVGDLQALSVAPSCLEFSPGRVRAILHPRPGYVPKVPTNVARSIILPAFHPPPHVSADQAKLHLLCPVRALEAYVHRTSGWRKSDQLFVCFGLSKKGSPVSKQTISKWIVEAISSAYEVRNLPSLLLIKAHSTRGVAFPRALLAGVSLQEVCDAAGWASPHTFIKHYSLDLSSTPGSQVLMS